jgi:hypothetical protein
MHCGCVGMRFVDAVVGMIWDVDQPRCELSMLCCTVLYCTKESQR